ncbi:MAG: hypothetical protein NT121_25570, partial [Chloroflexi bacterium]|nr:hypothetical protein [Chloroflexota bacterium]
MVKTPRFILIAIITTLLTSCAGNSGLWGLPNTPTPLAASPTTAVVATQPLIPSLAPSPSITPLMVLP